MGNSWDRPVSRLQRPTARLLAAGLFLMLMGGVAAQGDTPAAGAGAARITVEPPGSLVSSSTYSNGSFVIQNVSGDTNNLTRVTFDFSTTLLPEMVLDPYGTAGDLVAKDFTINSSSGITYNAPSGPNPPFTQPYKAGFLGMNLPFSGFQSNETFTFSVDADPTSIKGSNAPGPGESGSVSGLELVGATVTAHFSGGGVQTGQLFHKSNTGSWILLNATTDALQAPSLQLRRYPSPVTVRHPQQTLRVTAPAGANVELLNIEAGLYTPTCAGCTIGEYEVNSATAVRLFSGTIGANGHLDFPVTLTRTDNSSGIHYFAAVVSVGDDATSPLSNKIIVKYDPNADVNTPPDVVDDAYTMDEDTVLNGDVTDNDSDLDADPLTIALVEGVAHGLLTLNPDGTFSYAPNPNFFGQDSFTYQASDGYGGETEGTVTITVNPVNDPPSAGDDAYLTFTGVLLTVTDNQGVLKNDSDPDDEASALSAALATMPTNGTAVLAPRGGFTYQPDPGFTGTDTFTYTVSDDDGASDTATVTLTVEPVPGTGERLVNNSFEQHTEGKPDGWIKTRLKNDRIRCNLVGRPGKPDRIFALEGDCAFQFVGSASENSLLRQRADIADLNPGDTVQFIAHVRGKNVVSNAARLRMVAVYTDAPTKQMTINLPVGTYDYRRFTRTLQLAGQLKALRVDIQYLPRGTKGNFLVDMLSLRKLAAP